MSMERVYLDHAASTPLLPEARDAMAAAAGLFGNASAIHSFGREARAVIDDARSAIADLVGAEERDVVLTSGATESNALGILGYINGLRERSSSRVHVLASPFEHASVKAALATAQDMFGAEVEPLPVGKDGVVDPADVASRIRPDTVLVCVMWVNNIFGTVQPIAAAAEAVQEARRARGARGMHIAFMTDAVQGTGCNEGPFGDHPIDILTCSAHKIGGPKGTGALVLREDLPFRTIIGGGRHERGRRGGTENVQGIAGFGAAAAATAAGRERHAAKMRSLRERLLTGLHDVPGFVRVIGGKKTSPHIAYALFRQEGDYLAVSLDVEGVAVSSGSACDTGTRKTSDVLALVCDASEASRGGVRFSFGRTTTENDIDRALAALRKVGGR